MTASSDVTYVTFDNLPSLGSLLSRRSDSREHVRVIWDCVMPHGLHSENPRLMLSYHICASL